VYHFCVPTLTVGFAISPKISPATDTSSPTTTGVGAVLGASIICMRQNGVNDVNRNIFNTV
jgi:hypothetical protein